MLNENAVKNLSLKFNEPFWLLNKRLSAFNNFNQLEFPSFKYGLGIFIDVSNLNISNLTPLENKDETIIISDKKVEVLNFKEALVKYENLIKEYFMTKCTNVDENKFTALHAAFFNNAIFIRIPENTIINKPIQINFNANSNSSLNHMLVIAEKNSKATIIESSKSKNEEEQFISQIAEVIVKENANLEYLSVQNYNKSVYNFCRRNAFVEENGIIFWLDCSIGSKFTQSNISTRLEGVNSQSKNQGIVFGDDEQCFDVNNEAIHSFSRTMSNMLTKVVLNDKARTVYRGLIKIKPNAVNCEGYQKDDTILLSENSKADVVPNLEIANNDVKCTHGATISQIDEDKLFYMMSRGLDKKTAKKTIVEGFFDPILIKIQNESLRGEIISSISQRLISLD